ncbi:MAG: protein kinase, partial [Thermoanaerobaculia bacterium]|nr:protein kinase [Thermoanaerobaculia bacterium]
DFGLAKLRGMSRLTVAGSSLGTPSYMSPELASQEDAGPESDLWALGVLLYEMLVGHCPFRGGNPQAVIHSILGAEPEPMPADLELPSELRELVNSLLVKEPADRPSDATGIAGALLELLGDAPPGLVSVAAWSRRPLVRRASTWVWAAMAVTVIVFGLSLLSRKLPAVAPAGSPDPELSTAATPRPHPNSIVVLPLANRSSDPEQEYFSDGISEELLNLLTRIPELRVTSRTSAFSFKGQSLSAPEIARRLNVANVLEGSVRRDGDQVRISVQLIDAVSDTPRWSESYHRTLEDIFAIQDEIAADVATQLEVQLLGDPPTVEKVDPVAYELILQARRFANRSTADGLESAGQLLRRAIAIDPDSATAWAELAGVYSEQTGVGERSSTEGVRLAREATDRALAIDPNHVLALVQLSTIARMFDQDLAAAARYTSRPSASNLTTNWRSTLLAC